LEGFLPPKLPVRAGEGPLRGGVGASLSVSIFLTTVQEVEILFFPEKNDKIVISYKMVMGLHL